MHLLADAGKVVVLVSHRIAELAAHARRVVLILDGVSSAVLDGEALTQEGIASGLVTGQVTREAEEQVVVSMGGEAGSDLRLTDWTHAAGEFRGIDLHVRPGEIVAIVGVEGSGARELVRSVAGFERGSGRIEIGDRHGRSSAAATSLVSADRQTSLFSNLSIAENMVSRLSRDIAARGGRLRRGRMQQIAHDLRERFRVKAGSVHLPIRSLSGGNQQKVAIAAAIVRRPEVLVLEEPTRGVDIGSKGEIYRLMRAYAREGHAVIIYCTEVPEVFEAADFAYVVSEGRLSDPVVVMNMADVKDLARAITRLERHGVTAGVAPAATVA
jgi:ABC-type sugar transport system ATPase subunit